uniref:Uncharacterized protein n=1 Tax=Anguilla anguilla TaxID=7936 RepID=A0A0E9WB13_ANGAN
MSTSRESSKTLLKAIYSGNFCISLVT